MAIRIFLLLFLLVVVKSSFSQHKQYADIKDIIKVTFLSPGFSYEKRVGKFQSVVGYAFMSPAFDMGYSSSLGFRSSLTVDPGFNLQYRYYYNDDKRQKKGKRTEMNSLNYVSPTFETIFSINRVSSSHYMEDKRRAINTIGVVWGMQRNYNKRFSLDLSVGLGYLFTTATMPNDAGQTIRKNFGELSPLVNLSFGFWLNKK